MPEKTEKLEKLRELVDKFRNNISQFTNKEYLEDQLRIDFVNELFTLLGWDLTNKDNAIEEFRDVVIEKNLGKSDSQKYPDYAFRLDGQPVFFVEAKKPSINIKGEIDPAHQVRRYGYSAKLKISILTDFQEFAIYDTTIKPGKNDKASVALLDYFTFEDYEKKWDFLCGLLSKDAIKKGSISQYVGKGKKKGAYEVDKDFLKLIEGWRSELAKNIAKNNKKAEIDAINMAVQKVIDRIIFLRICEEKGIEQFENLHTIGSNKAVYEKLVAYFDKANKKYNSELFKPDSFVNELDIDDEILQDVIKGLYYPECPYAFSVLPVEILGNIYEQFLGKTIHLTETHQARIEEKPEVRKAGGVYYTPKYIVDYIVRNTVGEKIKGLTPKKLVKIKILDPACGSGSFLLGAYTYLLNYHLAYYVKKENLAKALKNEVIYATKKGSYKLTIQEKQSILLNNLFGVDIDAQAVEVTKLSLMLKLLEGEGDESAGKLFKYSDTKLLPTLSNNIKCGNSLIGPEFYTNNQMSMLDNEAISQVNAFDWQREYSEVMKAGGFDAIIGNPPYIRVRIFKELYPTQAYYLESTYKCAVHVWDVYLLFIERAMHLLDKDGIFGLIVPIQTLHQPNCASVRQLLLKNTSILSIADLSKLKVFKEAIVKNCILIAANHASDKNMISIYSPNEPYQLFDPPQSHWLQSRALKNTKYSLKLDMLSPKIELCEKLRAMSWQLEDLCYVTFGLRSCAKGVGEGGKERLITSNAKGKNVKPYLEGRDIGRYSIHPTGRYIKYIPEQMYSPREPKLFETKKIISQSMLSKKRLVATLDDAGYYVEQSLVCIIPHGLLTENTSNISLPLEFILGVINSKLEGFYFATSIIDYSLGGGLIHATPGSQGKLIIPKTSKPEIEKITALVKELLSLNKQEKKVKNVHGQELIQRQIISIDNQISQLVYKLYRLTKGEIAVVEGEK